MTSKETLAQQISVAKTILLQAVDLVDNHLTADEQLTVHSQYMPGSTIGAFLLCGFLVCSVVQESI